MGLQRCHFLMQLLPLSKNQSDYVAFVLKWKEQRRNENGPCLDRTPTVRQVEVFSSHPNGSGFQVLREETPFLGFSQTVILMSDEALRRFCKWKAGNKKVYVEGVWKESS